MIIPVHVKILLFFVIIAFPVLIFAMENSNKLEYFDLFDQHGNICNVNDNIKLIIFTKDKEASDIAHKALEDKKHTYLLDHNTVFISDISLMPKFVYKHFALPVIQKYSYLMLLINEPEKYYQFPHQSGKITLLRLEKMQIKSIEFISNPEKLLECIKAVK